MLMQFGKIFKKEITMNKKEFLKIISIIDNNKLKISVILAIMIFGLGFVGEMIDTKYNVWKSVVIAISLLGFSPPDDINFLTVTAFILVLILV